ncbi:MAG: DUF6528 family protein [Bacteroidota bacterium]
MKKKITSLIVSVVLLSLVFGCNSTPLEIIAGGDDRVIVIDVETSDTNQLNIVWSWRASEATDLPEGYKEYIRSVDECKSVDDNKKILLTSSSGGVILLDRETKQVLFYAHAPNAHSAEWLPNNRIIVALSTAEEGNRIELYDVDKPDIVLYKDSLFSGHGVVWIPKTAQLFALGYKELREYSLKNWDSKYPELQLENSWEIPGTGGHDLISVSDQRLLLTARDGVWNFDIPGDEFSSFTPLDTVRDVKSVNLDEKTQRLIYTKAEIRWWTHHIYCMNPDKIITVPDIRLYKVRTISE